MAGGRRKRRRAGSRLGPWVWGSALAVPVFALGLVAGAVFDGPRLLLRSLLKVEPVASIDVAASAPAEPGRLEHFSGFHDDEPRRPAAKPRPQSREPSAPERRPEPSRAAAKPPPAGPGSASERAMAELRRGGGAGAARPSPARRARRVVQVTSYSRLGEARELQRKLGAEGFDSYVSSPRGAAGGPYRVRVRPARGQSVEALEARLSARGFSPWVTSE